MSMGAAPVGAIVSAVAAASSASSSEMSSCAAKSNSCSCFFRCSRRAKRVSASARSVSISDWSRAMASIVSGRRGFCSIAFDSMSYSSLFCRSLRSSASCDLSCTMSALAWAIWTPTEACAAS
eukprot:Amastigsp_a341491_30.p4 type:complete len:123 gc:universal Amastigsp_a341491_30:1044-1412(+)